MVVVSMSVRRNLKQTVTYWAPQGTDRFGKRAFASPATLQARWEDTAELFINQQGQQDVSRSRVITADETELGGYLYLGTSADTDPTMVDGAFEIRSVRTQPDLRSLDQIYSAVL